MPPAARINRLFSYLGLNVAFIVLLCIGFAIGGQPNPRLLFLVLLFALCSTPLIDIDRLNGRFALLGMFMAVYFVSYGVNDLTDLFAGTSHGRPDGALSETEAIILTGGVFWTLAYRSALSVAKSRPGAAAPRDWSMRTVLTVGLLLWVVGSYATYMWSVHIVPDTTNDAVRKGLSSVSPIAITAYMLGQTLQPLGILLPAYALYAHRKRYLLPLIVGMVVLQVALGFVVDIKGMAMFGGVLVIVTCVLVTGRIPKAWLVAGALFVVFVFPIFTAYRTAIHGDLGLARTAVIENFVAVLQKTIAAEDRVNTGRDRAETFFERVSLKGSTQMIVEGVENGVGFQHGHTLEPILATFIPRVLWSDKPDVPTGQLVNKTFHVTDTDDIWISPSHLGELYWNFGWAGVIVGMSIFGLLCGSVGARCDMTETRTVTRLLVLVLTIKQSIVSFEGAIAPTYVVWLRSVAAIGVLHLLFARLPVTARSLSAARLGHGKLFPNLLS